jgi:DMSO/TMAO reductase YedYZ heme-binding membrane subunit
VRLGLVAIALMALHAGLFVLGATLRAGIFASQYLTPSFSSGYYRAVITVGLAALVLVVIGAISAAARWRMRRIWRVGHWAVFVAFGLGFIHSLLIGSESGSRPCSPFMLLAAPRQ